MTFHVKKIGLGAAHWFAHLGFVFRDQLADGRAGIVEVTGDNGVRGTDHHASRLQTDFGAMRAIMTFGRGAIVRI